MNEAIKNSQFFSTNVRVDKIKQTAMRLFLTLGWSILPGLTRRLIRRLFFSPLRRPLTDSQNQWLATGRRFHLNVHDRRIRGWKWGRGPQILFVHGWNGRGVQLHACFEIFLQAGYSVIAFDAPAHGQSEGHDTSYFEFTDAVLAFLEPGSGFDIRGIVAHSMGAAAVVNALAKTRLDTPSVLIAPALKLREILDNLFDWHGIPQSIHRCIIAEYEGQFGYSLEADNPHRLFPEIEAAVCIVHDRDDHDIPYIDSKSIADGFSNVLMHTTRGLGHRRILKDERVVNRMFEFLVESQRTDGGRVQQV